MDLQNSFVVPTDIDTAWKALQDVEGLAPCMPGATLQTHSGDEFTGNVKVKLGPVSMTFGGVANYVSKDEANHVMVIAGSGKDTRGGGTAKGQVTATLVAEAPDRTRVDVVTDLTITGKAAQFGRGVMQDVAGRIVDQFAANLATLLASQAAPAVTAEGEVAPPAPQLHHEESIDLLGTAGAPVLKRAIPIAIGAVVVIAIVVWAVSRGRKH